MSGAAAPTAATARAGNVAERLVAQSRARPGAPAVVHPGRRSRLFGSDRLSFEGLDRESDRLAAGMAAIGLGPGTRVALMAPPGLELFALVFALFKAGLVPVLVDPGLGPARLSRCLAEAAPRAFVGVPRAHLARRLLGWARASVETTIVVGPRLGLATHDLASVRAAGGADPVPVMHAPDPGEPAAILFTSGATGPPKGVVTTHAILDEQVRLLRATFGIEPGEVDLPTFPLFSLFDPALGVTAVVPPMDPTRPARADAARLFAAIEAERVTTMFGSPALVDRLGRAGPGHGRALGTLRRIVSAGAPMAPAILRRVAAVLPRGVQVFTPYGATEALPVSVVGSDEILGGTAARTERGAGVCIGRPVAGVEVLVTPLDDGPLERWDDVRALPDGEVGELAVRGPIVTPGYFRREEATRLAKMRDARGRLLHRMGDVGYRDAEGRLWFCGRKAQRVPVAGGTLFTVPCEGVFDAHPAVRRSALVGVPPGAPTRTPVLCVERERGARVSRARLVEELLARGGAHAHTRAIRTVLFHDAFPVDARHNAKIFRERLAAWAARRLA